MLLTLQRVLAGTFERTRIIIYYNVLYFQARNKMLNDIRQLCTFHISGDLLLYEAVELDYVTNCKLFDAVRDYVEETGRL